MILKDLRVKEIRWIKKNPNIRILALLNYKW